MFKMYSDKQLKVRGQNKSDAILKKESYYSERTRSETISRMEFS